MAASSGEDWDPFSQEGNLCRLRDSLRRASNDIDIQQILALEAEETSKENGWESVSQKDNAKVWRKHVSDSPIHLVKVYLVPLLHTVACSFYCHIFHNRGVCTFLISLLELVST